MLIFIMIFMSQFTETSEEVCFSSQKLLHGENNYPISSWVIVNIQPNTRLSMNLPLSGQISISGAPFILRQFLLNCLSM